MLGATLREFFRWHSFSSLLPSCNSYLIFWIIHFHHLNQNFIFLFGLLVSSSDSILSMSVSNLSSTMYFHAFLLQVQESRLRNRALDTVIRGSSPIPTDQVLWLQKKLHPLLFSLRTVCSSCCRRETQQHHNWVHISYYIFLYPVSQGGLYLLLWNDLLAQRQHYQKWNNTLEWASYNPVLALQVKMANSEGKFIPRISICTDVNKLLFSPW